MKGGIGLFIAGRRGYEVLSKLSDNKQKISSILILVQQKHEYENYTERIIQLASALNIPYKTTREIKPEDYKSYLNKTQPDVLFVISWRFLIPESCFSVPRFGIFVLHDSLLPKYRGFSPTNWVIINGEKITGLTLQSISQETDAGDIIDQIKIPLDKTETAKTLNDKFIKLYPKIILQNIENIFNGKITRVKQNNKISTYGCKRTPDDGKIDMSEPTNKIIRLVRGLTYPYPGAFCFYKQNKVIIWEAEEAPYNQNYSGRIPGRIVKSEETFLDVLTGDGILRILSVGIARNRYKPQEPKDIFKIFSEKLT